MKKLLVFLLAVLTALALVSCGGLTDKISGGDDSLEISEDDADAKMEQLASTDGYEITFDYTQDGSTGSYTVGKKGDLTWVLTTDSDNDVSGMAMKAEGDSTHGFTYDDGEWIYDVTYTGDDASYAFYAYELAYTYWFHYGNLYDGMLTKGSDTTVAGRKCYTYTFNLGLGLGAYSKLAGIDQYEYTIAVDKELGITLSLDWSVKAEGETAALKYEVTSFKTGNDVVLPSLPAAKSALEIAKLSLNDIKTSGIATVAPTIQNAQTASFSVAPSTNGLDSFNAWGSAIFAKCKAVADENTVYDTDDQPMADWSTVSSYIEFTYNLGETVVSVTLLYSSESAFLISISV